MKVKLAKILLLTVILSGLFILGCDNCIHCNDSWDDDGDHYYPPGVPYNIHSVTHDNRIELSWHPNYSFDFDYYKIYRNNYESGYYSLIAEVSSAFYNDYDVYNGNTYYYAISAVDIYGYESDLSTELIFDTPRPEGYGLVLWDVELYPNDAGIDFSEYSIVPWDNVTCDVFYGWDSGLGAYYIQVGNESTDIMNLGATASLTDVDYAPETGWDPEGWCYVNIGYSYVIWTADNHFAHLRVTGVYDDHIRFDWAYQTDTGNPELRIVKEIPVVRKHTPKIDPEDNSIQDNPISREEK